MTIIFTAQTDLTPYQHLEFKVSLDETNPPLKALAGRQLWARQSLAMNFKGTGRRAVGHAEPHPVVGYQGLGHAISETGTEVSETALVPVVEKQKTKA